MGARHRKILWPGRPLVGTSEDPWALRSPVSRGLPFSEAVGTNKRLFPKRPITNAMLVPLI